MTSNLDRHAALARRIEQAAHERRLSPSTARAYSTWARRLVDFHGGTPAPDLIREQVVGVMSKLPIGTITSHQTAVHPDDPGRRVFGRDLLQVEILDAAGNKLFTLYNTHLKSHFVPFGEDPVQGAIDANNRRRRQGETIARIIGRMERPNSRFVLTGDMNDPPDSPHLTPMLTVDGQSLVNALANPAETRPPKPETPGQGPGPQMTAWTHRFNPPGTAPPEYELFDHIWVSDALRTRFGGATIDRRTKHGGDGSDHDPAWIDLDV